MSNLRICGFLKIRNGFLRGDLFRIMGNLEKYVDDIFVCDDSSFDGTTEWLCRYLGEDHVLEVPADQHDFSNELYLKQKLLELVHRNGPWNYILWMDSDETLDANGTAGIRKWCEVNRDNHEVKGLLFHYTQLWQSTNWARTDSEFDEGNFLKLWRYEPTLSFEILPGTHNRQFPIQMGTYLGQGKIKQSPYEVIHWGNVGANLKQKILQYYGGLGGVDRHLHFEHATYRPVSEDQLPEGTERIPVEQVVPYTPEQVQRLEQMRDLHDLKKTFCIIIPTYNRAEYLKRTLDSVLAQTYEQWVCFVLDDGSTDATPYLVQEYLDLDPRFFFCRYIEHRGGCAVNEIGCAIAVNTCEFWTRLGSDDWWSPMKLERDAQAFRKHPEVAALYGPFQAHRHGVFGELCNSPIPAEQSFLILKTPGAFMASWANVAMRTSTLRKVKEKFGRYTDPQLMNMEDCLQNFRISTFTPWHWRGLWKGEFITSPSQELCREITEQRDKMEAEAFWNILETGASGNSAVYGRDRALTDQIIKEDLQQLEKERR